MTIICHYCGDPFEGRPNRVYCSTSCKSAINNQRYAERDYEAKKIERAIRANRSIVFKLYQLFGEQTLPLSIIEKTAIKTHFNSGAAMDGSLFCFLDFGLKMLPNNYYQILKTVPNK